MRTGLELMRDAVMQLGQPCHCVTQYLCRHCVLRAEIRAWLSKADPREQERREVLP